MNETNKPFHLSLIFASKGSVANAKFSMLKLLIYEPYYFVP